MEYIRNEEIEEAFTHEYRQYLTGHLKLPQVYLRHFEDDIEIGISNYEEFTADVPHVHPVATEHCLVLSGSVKIRCFGESTEEFEFRSGDYFMFRPGMAHASKNAPGTRIFFIKSPGIFDKTQVEVDEDTKEWLTHW